MLPLVKELQNSPKIEQIAAGQAVPGTVFLNSALPHPELARYSILAVEPFLTFSSQGSICRIRDAKGEDTLFGNPWRILDDLLPRFELLEDTGFPFPAGGCFGYFGYELNRFSEPTLPTRVTQNNPVPDCWLGFYSSLLVHDHHENRTWIIATGLKADGDRSAVAAENEIERWERRVCGKILVPEAMANSNCRLAQQLTREQYMNIVERAKRYIYGGDIYQVNLANRFTTAWDSGGYSLFENLRQRSPAPFAAYIHCGDLEIASSSPELFLRLSGQKVETRPIKGTRPRSANPQEDSRLAKELLASKKELAELLMITDLLRNDLGRFCEYGTVKVPDLHSLETYSQVHHLVSTVVGQMRQEVSHLQAVASAFPGGSITGAPKIRAMEIIHELEPIERGPYTGCIGYIGFNRESQLNIAIRTAVNREDQATFHAGAGIVADSDPASEYEETLAKASGFVAAIQHVAKTSNKIVNESAI